MKAFGHLTPEQVEQAKKAYISGRSDEYLDAIEDELTIEFAETGADKDHTEEELDTLRENRLLEIFFTKTGL